MEKFSRTKKSVFFRFYILWENFSKIGPIMKKIPNFGNYSLKKLSKFECTAENISGNPFERYILQNICTKLLLK